MSITLKAVAILSLISDNEMALIMCNTLISQRGTVM